MCHSRGVLWLSGNLSRPADFVNDDAAEGLGTGQSPADGSAEAHHPGEDCRTPLFPDLAVRGCVEGTPHGACARAERAHDSGRGPAESWRPALSSAPTIPQALAYRRSRLEIDGGTAAKPSRGNPVSVKRPKPVEQRPQSQPQSLPT